MQQGFAPPNGMRVCPGCGIVAPLGRNDCSVCKAPFGPQPLVAAGRMGTMVFACVHAADFTCKACGIRSPVASVDCGGTIECMGCGLRQAFDAEQWKDALGFAHGVADLSGSTGDALAQRSRHRTIGTEHTSATKTQNTMIMDGRGTRTYSLRTSVSPGHPLCGRCKAPLDARIEGETLATRCPRCGDAATYAMPPHARATYAALRGVISHEDRTDKPIAKLGRTQAGVESIVCPQCGAGMSAGQGSELVTCTYCNLAVRIPGTLARQQRRGAMPTMVPFWLVLEGPSIGRQRLARGKSEEPDDDDDDDEAPAPAFPQHTGWGQGPPVAFAPPPPTSRTGLVVGLVVGLGLLLLVAVGGGVAFWVLSEHEAPTTAPRPAPTARPKR